MILKSKEKFPLKDVSQIVYEKTGFYFKHKSILRQAFIRRSYSAKVGGECCEGFEFFGDSILGFIVKKSIAEQFGHKKNPANISYDDGMEFAYLGNEKAFTEFVNSIVSNEHLAGIIADWGLDKYILSGPGEIGDEFLKLTKPKADLFEAIIGAVAVETHWDLEILEKVVFKMLDLQTILNKFAPPDQCHVDFTLDSAITVLKEQSEKGAGPVTYETDGPEHLGYDGNGNPKWVCTCKVIEWGIVKQVWSNSKKNSKKCAAYLALCERFEKRNEYGPTKSLIGWRYADGQLLPDVLS